MLRHSNLNEQGIMHMSMEELKKQLKENKIGKLYLFTGSERYLIRYYVKEITDKILDQDTKTFNFTEYEGKVAFQQLSDTVSMFPAFSERRVVIIRESSLLKPGAGEINWKGFFESLPDYICLIFIQEEVDKRVSFYKTIKNCGLIVECGQQDEQALAKWAMKVFASLKKQIDAADAAYLVSLLEPDMTFMLLEIEKIAGFAGEKTRITRDIIGEVASKSVKSRIFDLTDAISARRMSEAIRIADELIELKEPVQLIMAMIGRHAGILMKAKRLEGKRVAQADYAKILGVHPFVAGKVRKQASSFSDEQLMRLIRMCAEMDIAVKTGRMDGRLALDLFMIEMGKQL